MQLQLTEYLHLTRQSVFLKIPEKNCCKIFRTDGTNIKQEKCPEINMDLEGIKVNALLDTGSESTCLSEEFHKTHVKEFQNKPTLPISGKVIKGATGLKSARIKKAGVIENTNRRC